ncbi:TetR/AcrR family transcriptional regulator [Winogradskya consettensis]|uniref:TetR family transcriptional regulator n=1 Tax=Winogradskya consettensis TaxID=113560 RepID=A0A919SY98_9ACTN|nr:TetR/AcrR family transcriptional regulator [Actinoplanes consettensis]GIM80985.1 TetR family transcriptional regulator [Actinoplanes consettensis]
MRADAQRNYDRIVEAASEAVARDGAEASLEEIARRAGVGSATLHRHFPNRWALMGAVFHGRTEELCERAGELESVPDPHEALVTWLRELAAYSATARGLAAVLLAEPLQQSESCGAMLVTAGEKLRLRAVEAGTVRPDVSIADLLTLVNAIALAAEKTGPAEAERLVSLAMDGISARPLRR